MDRKEFWQQVFIDVIRKGTQVAEAIATADKALEAFDKISEVKQ